MKLDKDYIKNNIRNLGLKYDLSSVFEDFILCCAYSIANSVEFKIAREKMYLNIVQKYNLEEFNTFSKMLAALCIELNKDNFDDVIGTLYEELGLFNSHLGQFFTPIHISRLMSNIFFDKEDILKKIEESGYYCVSDSCCGSGRLMLAEFELLKKNNIDLNKVYFSCGDISDFCCQMTYINLSIIGANAIVYNQNALTQEYFDSYITPVLANNKELLTRLEQDNILVKKEVVSKDKDEDLELEY